MNNWQKVINVSLAVIVTLLIYQNQQLQKEVDTLEQVGLDIQLIKDRVGIKPVKESEYGGVPVYWTVNERLTSYGLEVLKNQSAIEDHERRFELIVENEEFQQEKFEMISNVLETNATNIKTLSETTDYIQKYLSDNFKGD